MKHVFFSLMLLALSISSIAQSEKFVAAMTPLIPASDTARTKEGLSALSNSFERIANAEKTQWLPYYYAAYCKIREGMMYYDGQFGDKSALLDPFADKAEELLNKADAIEKNNSEIYCVKKMLSSLRLIANPMGRYMEYGQKGAEQLETAKKLDPENPRVFILEGMDKVNTPEQFGGNKAEGKALLETAIKKFETFKPKSSLHPSWGMPMTRFYLAQLAANK